MPRNYAKGVLASVTMQHGGAALKYAFRSRMQRESNRTALGQTLINVATINDVQNLVLGCNAPKPARASKTFDTNPPGSESSFCSDDKIVTLKADGWSITPRKAAGKPSFTPRSQTVYVTVNGIKYAWRSSRAPDAISAQVNLAQIGVKVATATETGLVFGCSFPKPPLIGKVVKDPEDDADDFFSTMADPTSFESAIQAGWQSVNKKGYGLISADDFKSVAG